MPLTDNPYLPFYVKDWMTNNKLKLCSPSAHGIMINIMCIMHKEDDYGKILLKQKFKQSDKQVENFACQVARLLAFDLHEILPGLRELIDEGILIIEGDHLICERMVKDAKLSETRASSGRKGGKKTQSKKNEFASDFAKAKVQANTGNGIGIGIGIGNGIVNGNNKKGAKNSNSKIRKIQFPYQSEKFMTIWDEWKDYKSKEHNFKFKSEQSEQAQLTSLSNLAKDEDEAIKIIIQSMANGWKGFFQLKNEQNGSFKSNGSTASDKYQAGYDFVINSIKGNRN